MKSRLNHNNEITLSESQQEADGYLENNIVEARGDHDKLCDIWRRYVTPAETDEERLRRINLFRCGGW